MQLSRSGSRILPEAFKPETSAPIHLPFCHESIHPSIQPIIAREILLLWTTTLFPLLILLMASTMTLKREPRPSFHLVPLPSFLFYTLSPTYRVSHTRSTTIASLN